MLPLTRIKEEHNITLQTSHRRMKITGIQEIVADLEKRVADNILEQSNFDLLKKLVENADSLDEAIKIAELGTTYKRTGFHFDKRLEKQSNTISYFKKNDALSFETNANAITHKLIVGDNYPALLNLLVEYKGRIDVIYIDPPYGKDSMGEFAETNYNNAITRDNLLSMLYPRLYLAKQLLSDSGVIFCSIDDRNLAYVKCLFDEVFEESNFVGQWNWYKSETPPNLSLKIKKNIEYILCYERRKDSEKYTGHKKESSSDDPFTKPQNTLKELRFPSGSINIKSTEKLIPKGTYGTDKYPNELLNDIENEDGKNKNPVTFKNKFIWTQDKLESEILGGTVINLSKKGVLSYKKANYDPEVPPNFISAEVGDTNENARKRLIELLGGDYFDYPKPVALLKYIIDFKYKEDAIILDFFAGSGTTGQAVLELNQKDYGTRQYICVQLNENLDDSLVTASRSQIKMINDQIALCDKYNRPHFLSEVTAERLRRVMTGKDFFNKDVEWSKDNEPLGDNLLVLDIAEVSNFEAVEGKTAFDVIDETLYGKAKFETVKEKVEWVCDNFEMTQKRLEE